MSALEKEDLVDIVKFYKDKVSEIEFQYLVLQIDNKKNIKELNEEFERQKLFIEETYKVKIADIVKNHGKELSIMNAKINKLSPNKKLESLKKGKKIKEII